MAVKRSYYMNRTLCDVLDDMRKCDTTKNYAPLLALIEEAQVMGNRMEAALSDQKDIGTLNEEWHELRSKVKAGRKVVQRLKKEAKRNGKHSKRT